MEKKLGSSNKFDGQNFPTSEEFTVIAHPLGQNSKYIPTVKNQYGRSGEAIAHPNIHKEKSRPGYIIQVLIKDSFRAKTNKSIVKNVRLRWLRRIFLALFFIVVIFSLVFWMTLPNVDSLVDNNPDTTAFIELRKTEAAKKGEPFSLHWKWHPIKRISPYLLHAVVKAEDRMFWSHSGVDWGSIQRIVEESWEEKKLPLRGGSTITQQLAKNLYLSPSYNPVRKLREFFIARRLESELSKERILELYLNVSEWGDGVFGAEAAARKWYAASSAVLKPSQAARLAVALPNPLKYTVKRDAIWLDHKASFLLRSMRRKGLISQDELELAYANLGLSWKSKADSI